MLEASVASQATFFNFLGEPRIDSIGVYAHGSSDLFDRVVFGGHVFKLLLVDNGRRAPTLINGL